MVNRIGWSEETEGSEALDRRLKNLSNFQAMLLRHALRFPSVRRVVYSTCSVHERENELVIRDVLQQRGGSEFRLVGILPNFPGRGKSSELPEATRCVRMSPETSLTVGFFIACLERVDKVTDRTPSSSVPDFKKEDGVAVSESTASEVQAESVAAVDERRKSHKRKKTTEEKTVKLEYCELDTVVVKEEPKSDLDGSPQMTESQCKRPSFISEPTTDTTETETVRKSRRSHKRKKSMQEKSAELEYSEFETSVVKEEQSSELDEPPQRSTSEKPSFVSETTTGIVETEPVEKIGGKSHKRKKSKRDKAAKLPRLECLETDAAAGLESLDHDQNSPDLLPARDVMQTEPVITADKGKKSHKRKKSKKEKAVDVIKQSEADATAGVERLGDIQNLPDCPMHSDVMQTDDVATADGKKSHKHKKSKKEKATSVVERSKVDATAGLERLDDVQNLPDHPTCDNIMQTEQVTTADGKRSHKRKKSKKEKATDVVEQSEVDAAASLERLDDVKNIPDHPMCDVKQTEQLTTADGKRSHKHKKSKKEKATDVVN